MRTLLKHGAIPLETQHLAVKKPIVSDRKYSGVTPIPLALGLN